MQRGSLQDWLAARDRPQLGSVGTKAPRLPHELRGLSILWTGRGVVKSIDGPGLALDVSAGDNATPADAVNEFLARYGGLFDLPSLCPALFLHVDRVAEWLSGGYVVRVSQTWCDLPVFGAGLKVAMDSAHRIKAVHGFLTGDLAGESPVAKSILSEAKTRRLAAKSLKKSVMGTPGASTSSATLGLLDPEALGHGRGPRRLAWHVALSAGTTSYALFLDAIEGTTLHTAPVSADASLVVATRNLENLGDAAPEYMVASVCPGHEPESPALCATVSEQVDGCQRFPPCEDEWPDCATCLAAKQ